MLLFLDKGENFLQKKVYAYRDGTKKCWSIEYDGGVIAHARTAFMWDVEFMVDEAGRQRSLKMGVAAPHAYASCNLDDIFLPSTAELLTEDLRDSLFDCTDPLGANLYLRVRYEPKRRGSFMERDTGRNIHAATHVYLTVRGGLKAQRCKVKAQHKERHAKQNFRRRLTSDQQKTVFRPQDVS
tara:strand:- start:1201 stop:1749 length:549 start_codon:yes stop_codon:yes gene_type:complete